MQTKSIYNLEDVLALNLFIDWEINHLEKEDIQEFFEPVGYSWVDNDFQNVYYVEQQFFREMMLNTEKREKLWFYHDVEIE